MKTKVNPCVNIVGGLLLEDGASPNCCELLLDYQHKLITTSKRSEKLKTWIAVDMVYTTAIELQSRVKIMTFDEAFNNDDVINSNTFIELYKKTTSNIYKGYVIRPSHKYFEEALEFMLETTDKIGVAIDYTRVFYGIPTVNIPGKYLKSISMLEDSTDKRIKKLREAIESYNDLEDNERYRLIKSHTGGFIIEPHWAY